MLIICKFICLTDKCVPNNYNNYPIYHGIGKMAMMGYSTRYRVPELKPQNKKPFCVIIRTTIFFMDVILLCRWYCQHIPSHTNKQLSNLKKYYSNKSIYKLEPCTPGFVFFFCFHTHSTGRFCKYQCQMSESTWLLLLRLNIFQNMRDYNWWKSSDKKQWIS